jgi:cold shock CspA family protein/Flp pilus assembly protein TadD
MDARVVQEQVLIGSGATFFLRTGQTLSGTVLELNNSYIVIEVRGRKATILLEMIGGLIVEEEAEDQIAHQIVGNDFPNTVFTGVMHTDTSIPLETTSHQSNGHSNHNAPSVTSDETATSEVLAEAIPSQPHSEPAAAETPATPINPETIRLLLAVEAKYEARIQVARLEPDKIDFQFPSKEIEEKYRTEAHTAWQNIKSIYDYAVKVQEVDPKHGRTGRFAYQLARLAEQYPEAHTLKRQAAYAAILAEQPQNALELWKKVAIARQTPDEWKNVAAVALTHKADDVACYALTQYYTKAAISEVDPPWVIFVNLVSKFSNYSALLSISRSRSIFTTEEMNSLFEAGIYLTKLTGQVNLAESYIIKVKDGALSGDLIEEIFRQLPQEPTASYAQRETEFETMLRLRDVSRYDQPIDNPTQDNLSSGRYYIGHITSYKEDKGYGFILSEHGNKYFFHVSSVPDPALIRNLKEAPQDQQQVRFLTGSGERGQFAYNVEMFRSIEDMAQLAFSYADQTEYHKAAAEMRNILRLQPDYPDGQSMYAKLKHFAAEKKLRAIGLPRGNGYYARAKCADIIEDNHERAVGLYKLAIKHHERVESAVKDLAMVLDQLGRINEAIDILNDHRNTLKDQRAVDGLLMTLYQKAGEADKAIPLLYKRAEEAPNTTKQAPFLWSIASLYLGKREFDTAERVFRQFLDIQPGNTIAKRHIAICLLKQSKFDEAEALLNEILEQTSDAQSAEVLSAVQQARSGGVPSSIDILINTALSDFFTEISTFTKFFLDRCEYKGVPADRIQAQAFRRADIEQLAERASGLSTRLPRERSSLYLSAAKINSILEDSDPNRFYRYLCRSFASLGDAIVQESSLLDSACDLYCEALAVYDNDHSRSGDEQDAANALIRVMYSTLGVSRIPTIVTSKHLAIDEAIESVISQHPNRARVFHYIAYLIYRSRYAAARILTRLYRSNWSGVALDYLRSQSVEMPESVENPDEFARLWDTLRRRRFDDYRVITNEFSYLMRIEIVPSAIENCISRIRSIGELLFFELDRERLRESQRILEVTVELCRQTAFEERERFCLQADSRCRELIREIETSPTKFSIEQLLPVLQSLQQKLSTWLEELYQRSTPSLSLRLAIESYSPDNDRQIEVQIAIENQAGRSPAEGLELVVLQESEQTFSLTKSNFRIEGSLRGGDQAIILIPLQLTSQALSAEAFSMGVYVLYRTRSEQEPLVIDENFSIQMATAFEEFDNPYKAYAKGGVVRESEMFYGRQEMVNSIVHTLMTNPSAKSIILYGQKRSGKSSILYHLKETLNLNHSMLVLDIENIGILLNENASTPLLYQILWTILRHLQRSIRKREELGYSELALEFPTDLEFYSHPAPLSYFIEFFEDFKDHVKQRADWKNVRVVLLADEFSYIYGYIVRGTLSKDFMVNWKALLQRNYFSTVLAGQDVMPKFIKEFPNEWATTEDRQVGYLSDEDARALIDEPIRIGGKSGESRYREKAIEHIIELTAGSPFYIQIICNRLVESMRLKRRKLATKADVQRIQDSLIQGIDALKINDFENLINSGDTSPDAISDSDALQVLKVVARNTQQTSTCARGEIICETEKPTDIILEDLVNRNVLVCERGNYYRIYVGLFKEWLIANS